jgi:hypothetical protein
MVYQKYSPYASDSAIVNFNFALCNSLLGGLWRGGGFFN